jgi:hypothetical protein
LQYAFFNLSPILIGQRVSKENPFRIGWPLFSSGPLPRCPILAFAIRVDSSLQSILSAMLSAGAQAQIKAEIERLEELCKICNDRGIRKVIEGWIAEQKKKLAEGMTKAP